MESTPLPDDEPLLALLKAKLDSLTARRPDVNDPQELAQLSRQYQAIMYALVELGYPDLPDLESQPLYEGEPDYNLYQRLIFSAQNMPDIELQVLMWNQAGYLIRTPIGTIKTSAYLLSRGAGGELSEKQAGYVERIADQADHLSAAFEKLLSDARAKMAEWSGNTGSESSHEESKT